MQACPPSAAYRFRKFARRHKAALLVASLAIAALLVLVVGLVVSNRMIANERNEKADALALAEVQSNRAKEFSAGKYRHSRTDDEDRARHG